MASRDRPTKDAVERARGDVGMRVNRLWFDPHVLIYATIILLTAIALFDEGESKLSEGAALELLAVTIAPLFALAMAHTFSDALDLQIRNKRRLTGRDRRALLRHNLQYLIVAIPPVVIVGILTLLGWTSDDAVEFIIWTGLASLVFWGGFAAYQAQLAWWRQVTFALSYGLMGFLVILVELILTH